MTDTTVESPKIAQIVEKYIALRDKKSELKAAYDASVKDVDTAMDRVENYLLATMQELGVDSVKTPFGTPYISMRTSATVADWPAVLGFIRESQAWEMLERRVNKTFVDTFRKEQNDLPPGVNYREERVVNVRRNA